MSQFDIAWVAAGAALFGSLIGALASVVVTWIQQRQQTKRDVFKIATELAHEEWKQRLQRSQSNQRIAPVSVFVHYHAKLIEAVAKRTYSEELIKQLGEEQQRIMGAHEKVWEASDSRHQKRTEQRSPPS